MLQQVSEWLIQFFKLIDLRLSNNYKKKIPLTIMIQNVYLSELLQNYLYLLTLHYYFFLIEC